MMLCVFDLFPFIASYLMWYDLMNILIYLPICCSHLRVNLNVQMFECWCQRVI